MTRSVTQSYVSMTIANMVILALTAASYIVYSRLLTPTQFAIFGTALTCSRVCVMLLDGGIRNVLIADQAVIGRSRYTAISAVLFCISLILIAFGYCLSLLLDNRIPNISFVLAYIIPFLMSYALFFSSMVRLEKAMSYGRIAIIEATSTLIELLLPAVLILALNAGLPAFVAAAFISRSARTILFWCFSHPRWEPFSFDEIKLSLKSIKTSLWFQYAILSNAIRDNLPILLVAPIYGTQWAGYYVWALQICAVSSQFAVAAASRIALPLISGHETHDARYDVSAQQVRWLSKLLGPVLVAVWLVVPVFNALVFKDKWTPALVLLPWLLLRMMPSIGTTILSPLTFVQFGPKWLAMVSTAWTMIEVASAWLLLQAFGPIGLAYSYAVCVWFGIALMVGKIRERRDLHLIALFRTIMANQSTVIALLLGTAVVASRDFGGGGGFIGGIWRVAEAGIITCVAYLSDAKLRSKMISLLYGIKLRLMPA